MTVEHVLAAIFIRDHLIVWHCLIGQVWCSPRYIKYHVVFMNSQESDDFFQIIFSKHFFRIKYCLGYSKVHQRNMIFLMMINNEHFYMILFDELLMNDH